MLIFGIFINLVTLAIFKYSYFFLSEVLLVKNSFLLAETKAISLPIGISFFTFQGISYLIDIHRKDIQPSRNIGEFFSYLSFFPQLIAGPIVRYADVLADLNKPKRSLRNASFGAVRFAHGLAKKVLLADTFGLVADYAFLLPGESLSRSMAIVGIFAYSLQIYFDFSGYSDMAIGIGQMIGIRIKENFSRPYSSSTISEFWRRWHISLSNWFRDYLYIPLGGNKAGTIRTYTNLFIVFLLCGFWHGAAWNFIAWGLYHGLFISIERLFLAEKRKEFGLLVRLGYFLPVTLVGWLIFRAESLQQIYSFFGAIMGTTGNGTNLAWQEFFSLFSYLELTALAIFSLIFILPRNSSAANFINRDGGMAYECFKISYGLFALLVSLIVSINSDYSPFLYFRF